MLVDNKDKETDVKDITARYTTDTICSCAFGLDNNSLTEKDNEMRNLGNIIMTIPLKSKIRSAILRAFPKLIGLFNVK